MYRPLSPCSSCHRHVLVSADGCPFCGASLELEVAPVAQPSTRLSRAAMVMLGASLSMTGCASKPVKPLGDNVDPVPTTTANPTTTATATPPDDDGTMHAEYGAPVPVDTAAPTAGPTAVPAPPDDDGGMRPKYGAPPRPLPKPPKKSSTAPDDNGQDKALYGMPSP